ncbi:succinylglutamate desuccinylase/aspartoacylase family protein [Butyrivibrio sp. AE2032]|uniref:succinylglutamate desuccinylase/aspartoacylase family protein n=1 Tax=Butyrivibrio sp. AE2032 TaxID=1458463 RepID=UPI00068C3B49|nr:succinylglutamate desuccinylase/aspartoacylase family protein [Butyrivibrio sp. AE2032]
MSYKMIAGHELIPGKTIKDHIHVEGTELHIPHVFLCGEHKGPTVLISAGIHNAEYVGIQAAIELSGELDPSTLSGNVIILPLANRSGFENRTMSMVYEDGKNLNRVFPGDNKGSEADRLAHMIFNVFIKNVDAYIDLHSGDGFESLIPYAYYLGSSPAEETARQMISCIDTKYCVRSRCTTGGAYNLASIHGVPSVLIERGQLSLFSRDEIEADKADVINILKYLGVLEGSHKSYPKKELTEYDIDSPCTGCWYPSLEVGTRFAKGDCLGQIRDYFGHPIHECIAPSEGILLHQCASLNVIEGDPLIAYGVQTGKELS